MAILQWAPRVTLSAIHFVSDFNGARVVELTNARTGSAQPLSS